MKLLLQRHKFACGATSIAMAAGVSLLEAEQVNGVGKTTTKRMIQSLRTLGVTVLSERLVRPPRFQPRAGDIVRIRWAGLQAPKPQGHWAVCIGVGRDGGGIYFDPVYGATDDAFYRRRKRGRVTGFLPLRTDTCGRVMTTPHLVRPVPPQVIDSSRPAAGLSSPDPGEVGHGGSQS